MIDLHRHDDYSLFDGLGKPFEMACLAKEYGYTALSQSNHGTASGFVEHYIACKEAGIKPVMGVEVYFMPKFDKDKRKYHLCLFCKNLTGYKNLNRILSYANINQFYYKPIVTFDLLEKYHEGIICTSACLGGYPSSKLAKGIPTIAEKALVKFKKIFGKDFYVEVQPYKVSEKGLQERVNVSIIKLADKLKIECILTSDSHYGKPEDFDTFVVMHSMRVDIKKNDDENNQAKLQEKYNWVKGTYGERHMPKLNDLRERFIRMHREDFDDIKGRARRYCKNLDIIVDSIDENILDQLEATLPEYEEGINSEKQLKLNIKKGLQKRGKYDKEHWDRCMEEFDIIREHGFHDYFLIVQDYVMWAKNNGIAVGPGRGSVCNCEVAYALGITDVDSLYFELDFRRFLRKDKKKLPDIDIDFETSRRGEVIEYLIRKYKGRAVQICSFGLFKVDNLLNDLFKVCGVMDDDVKKAIKKYVGKDIELGTVFLDYENMQYENKCKELNARYKNIVKHFSKLFRKIKYVGTHAAGVAIVGTNIFDYTSVERHGKNFSSAYDLSNLDRINVLKFDMLGLRTLSITKELSDLSGEKYTDEWLKDKKVFKRFGEGDTEAIFQFERPAAANILMQIQADCIEDVTAANALNRPGPLSLGMPEQYGHNKNNLESVKESKYYEMTKDTYGTVVYQEQIVEICRKIGMLSWEDSDKVLKFMKGNVVTELSMKVRAHDEDRIIANFVEGSKKNGLLKKEAMEIWNKIVTYSFNKGHALGYALIAVELMWYKVYHPMLFWYCNLKYCNEEANEFKYKKAAIAMGTVILLPHINGPALYGLEEVDGEMCIQEGLITIKGVGEKAAMAIEAERMENGPYLDIDDMEDRNEKKVVNARVLKVLKEHGASQMDMNKFYAAVVKYNTSLSLR